MSLEYLSESKYFAGRQIRFKHRSSVNNCEMIASIFLPKESEQKKVPVLYWLSGLTCTDENFVNKSGMQRYAAEYGIAVVAPDTSPRGEGVPGDPEGSWDFALGAGYYLNATEEPWDKNYQMYDYIVRELPALIEENFSVDGKRLSISGHSMGGHGALTIALKNPDRYKSVSAFAPIVNPINSPWGQKAFTYFLGDDKKKWNSYDTCELIKKAQSKNFELLVDQGTKDSFLEKQLKTEELEKVCNQVSYPLTLNYRDGYDHSYSFVASFLGDHMSFHAKALKGS